MAQVKNSTSYNKLWRFIANVYCLNIKATLLFQNVSSENEMVSNLSLQVDDVL